MKQHGGTMWDRFWSRVDKTQGCYGCWPWTGRRNDTGYGQAHVGPKRRNGKLMARGTHRVVWEIVHRCQLRWLDVVMHTCNNKICCNPRHLKLGTRAENAAAAARDGLYPSGERAWNSKLSAKQVRYIRQHAWKYGERAAYARKLGVSKTIINHVLCGRTWKGLP